MKKYIVTVELCALLILTIIAGIFGFNKGVWDGTTYYGISLEENKKVYVSKGASVVEIMTEAAQNAIDIHTKEGNVAQLSYDISENGVLKTIRILSNDNAMILSDTYDARAREWITRKESGNVISDHFWDNEHFNLSISDKAILNMTLGNVKGRISGRIADFLIAVLFLVLGFSFNYVTELLVRIDKYIIGIFYENAKDLRASNLGQTFLALLGIVFFVIGVLICKSVLLS